MVGGYRFQAALVCAGFFMMAVMSGCSSSTNTTPTPPSGFVVSNLVANRADTAFGAGNLDQNLTNAWGIAVSNATGNPFFIAANHGNCAVNYNAAGIPLMSAIRLPQKDTSKRISPTGIVTNASAYFQIPGKGTAQYLVCSEEGVIDAIANPPVGVYVADHTSAGANYKGIAISTWNDSAAIYAADFNNAALDVYDNNFKYKTSIVTPPSLGLPPSYAPFNIRYLSGRLFVMFARQKNDGSGDDSAGTGNGYVAIFDPAKPGSYKSTVFVPHDSLNAPWGIAIAPTSFGDFGGKLLISNFGSGHINAYDPSTGAYLGQLKDAAGKVITIPGIWDIATNVSASPSTLFYTAGPNDESDGVFGTIVFK